MLARFSRGKMGRRTSESQIDLMVASIVDIPGLWTS